MERVLAFAALALDLGEIVFRGGDGGDQPLVVLGVDGIVHFEGVAGVVDGLLGEPGAHRQRVEQAARIGDRSHEIGVLGPRPRRQHGGDVDHVVGAFHASRISSTIAK